MPISLFLYLCYNGHCVGCTLGLPANDINTLMEEQTLYGTLQVYTYVYVRIRTYVYVGGCGQLLDVVRIARRAFNAHALCVSARARLHWPSAIALAHNVA